MTAASHKALQLVPALLTLLAILLSAAALPQSLLAITPLALLPCLYFWTFFRPKSLPLWVIFPLGLLTDVLLATPLGATVLIALLLYAYTLRLRARQHRQTPFVRLWKHYAIGASGALLLLYLLLCLYHWHGFDPLPVMAQWLLTVLLYPPLHGLFFLLLNRMPRGGLSHGH